MAQFLSTDWFDKVATLNEEAGELNLPPTLANLRININITGDQTVSLYLKEGKIAQGTLPEAVSTISIDKESLLNIINGNDINLAIEAFMMGKIRVDGDMSAVMNLQSTKPTAEQKLLYKRIKNMTVFVWLIKITKLVIFFLTNKNVTRILFKKE